MSTILVRRLDKTWDMTFGNGKACYIADKEAIAQIIKSRLLLFLEEWWMNQDDGLPMFQSILGIPGAGNHKDAVDRLITERILGTPYVQSVESVSSNYNPDTRAYSITVVVNTTFGQMAVSNSPVPFAAGAGGRA